MELDFFNAMTQIFCSGLGAGAAIFVGIVQMKHQQKLQLEAFQTETSRRKSENMQRLIDDLFHSIFHLYAECKSVAAFHIPMHTNMDSLYIKYFNIISNVETAFFLQIEDRRRINNALKRLEDENGLFMAIYNFNNCLERKMNTEKEIEKYMNTMYIDTNGQIVLDTLRRELDQYNWLDMRSTLINQSELFLDEIIRLHEEIRSTNKSDAK